MSDIKRQLMAELRAINRLFKQHNIGASVHPKRTCIAGSVFISCGVTLASGETIERVEKRLPELSEAITMMRRCPTPVRAQRMPFALEMPHPKPEPMVPTQGMPKVPPHSMLLGRSFNPLEGGKVEVCKFSDFPHTLVAGTTGAGKSVLVNWMLLSLCRYTSPDELRIILIDLKNEDLLPFKNLPHVDQFVFDMDGAKAAINHCHDEVQQRVASGRKPYRLLLVIDELAELQKEKQLLDLLGSYLARGRSKWCNSIIATQHPTADVIGRLGKPNLTHRLGGLCTDADTARIVAGRPQSFLHLLPGKGSFTRIYSNNMIRMQTYFLGDGYRQRLIDGVKNMWGNVRPTNVINSPLRNTISTSAAPGQAPPSPAHSPTISPTLAPLEYIGERQPTDTECITIHYAIDKKTHSKNALQKLLFGSKSSRNSTRLSDALARAETLLSSAQEQPQTQTQTAKNRARIIPFRRVVR